MFHIRVVVVNRVMARVVQQWDLRNRCCLRGEYFLLVVSIRWNQQCKYVLFPVRKQETPAVKEIAAARGDVFSGISARLVAEFVDDTGWTFRSKKFLDDDVDVSIFVGAKTIDFSIHLVAFSVGMHLSSVPFACGRVVFEVPYFAGPIAENIVAV